MLLSILACKPQDGTLCIFFTRTSHLTDSGKSGLNPIRSLGLIGFWFLGKAIRSNKKDVIYDLMTDLG